MGWVTSSFALDATLSGRSLYSANQAGVKIAGLKSPTKTTCTPLISGSIRMPISSSPLDHE